MLKLTPAEQPVWDAFVVATMPAVIAAQGEALACGACAVSDASNPWTLTVEAADALIEARREREGKTEEPVNARIAQLVERMESACEVAYDYAQIEGDHHRMWVIDQMLRALLRDDYEQWIAVYEHPWDVGIAP